MVIFATWKEIANTNTPREKTKEMGPLILLPSKVTLFLEFTIMPKAKAPGPFLSKRAKSNILISLTKRDRL